MDILTNIRSKRPLIHCITNYVTVNDVANALLSFGAAPVMADDEREVEQMVSIANALVINIGTLNERTINAMIKAGRKANELKIPVVLDPVGVGATELRTDTAFKLIDNIEFSLIRANISEAGVLAGGFGRSRGVDASSEDIGSGAKSAMHYAKMINKRTGAIVAVSGKVDVVTDGVKISLCENGHEAMSRISGTGCMLSALLGAFLTSDYDKFTAVSEGVATMAICGERAFRKTKEMGCAMSMFRTLLIDGFFEIDDEILEMSKMVTTIDA